MKPDDVKFLQSVLTYEPKTGMLRWKKREPDTFIEGKFSKQHIAGIWNSRYAGKEAGRASPDGRRQVRVNGKHYLSHRVAWAIHYGAWPNKVIDHINGDPTDNRLCNLRDVERVENQRNQKLNKRNSSGVMGVSWSPRHSKWRSRVNVKGKEIYIGLFANFDDAVAARKKSEAEYGFHENHGCALRAKREARP